MNKIHNYNIGYITWTQVYNPANNFHSSMISQQQDEEIENSIKLGNLSDATKIIGVIMAKNK